MYTIGRLVHELNQYDKQLNLDVLLEREEVGSSLESCSDKET
jgi:hypothetical protein